MSTFGGPFLSVGTLQMLDATIWQPYRIDRWRWQFCDHSFVVTPRCDRVPFSAGDRSDFSLIGRVDMSANKHHICWPAGLRIPAAWVVLLVSVSVSIAQNTSGPEQTERGRDASLGELARSKLLRPAGRRLGRPTASGWCTASRKAAACRS